MTSRTPIRLTPHRGPLATPSTSPESSPTLSTPPTDISHCSTIIGSALDVAILQHRISTLSSPTRRQYRSPLHRRRHNITRQGLSDHGIPLSPLSLIFENLVYQANELAKTLAGIVMFCLFTWGLLEWSSYASGHSRQPSPWTSMSRFPLPHHTRDLRCYRDSSLCEPRDQHIAVLQFLSQQIQHAKALSSLSVGLGQPLRAFLEAHRATIPRAMVGYNSAESQLVREADVLANLTEFLDPSLLDFTPGSFIGRSFTLAMEELGDLVFLPTVSRGSAIHGESQDVRLHAIYWRTASNLLLEYSAARQRARRLSHHVLALRQQLLSSISSHHITGGIEGKLNTGRWKGSVRRSATSIEDETQAFVTGLEVTLDNAHRLVAYLDWITWQLAQTSLKDILEVQHRTDFSSCLMSLQELFARSKPPSPKKFCLCLDGCEASLPNRPEKVEIMVPGSPTVRAEHESYGHMPSYALL